MANALGRGVIRIKDVDAYGPVKKLYVKKGTDWRDAKTAWVKQNGEWIQVYPTPRAEISIDPPTLDFKAANGYESPTQFVNITNNGTEDLIIEDFSTSYTIAGKFVTFFDLTDLGGALPTTIAPGETKRLGIAIDAGSGAAFLKQEIVVVTETPSTKTVNILNPLKEITVDCLVVAGGGAGGATYKALGPGYIGSGGGAGGVISGAKATIPRGSAVKVVVGQGGSAGNYNGYGGRIEGGNGGNSIFGSLIAIGGGGAGGPNSPGPGRTGHGLDGGSGGGGWMSLGGNGTAGQGNPGGHFAGGGAGGGGYYSSAVDGFPGIASKITGTKIFYGGGGAAYGGKGGVGGGGNAGHPGAPNTGGGGGNSGDGGSGIVIVSYAYDKQLAEGGTVTSYNSSDGITHWVHTFTQNGTFTYKEIIDTIIVPITVETLSTATQLVQTNTGELGSSDSTIRMKTNVGAFGIEYVNYTIFGEVVPPYAEIDILPGLEADIEYFRYNPRQTRQEFTVTNIGTGSLIITGITCVTQYFNIISYPDAVAPQQTGTIVVESRADENTAPGTYTDIITIKSNNIKGDVELKMSLDVVFPAGNVRISTAGIGTWTVPDGVYRLSEVRVIGGGGGGGQGFNQQGMPLPVIPDPNPNIAVDYLIVGAGGSGGASGAGGGGGGVLTGSRTISKGQLNAVTVGAASTPGVIPSYVAAFGMGPSLTGGINGAHGGFSSFAGITAQGGGIGGGIAGGFSFGSTNFFNSDGGSGGGGSGGYPGTAGQGTLGQGYPGGAGGSFGVGVTGTAGDGGGGGAGGPGGSAYGSPNGGIGYYARGVNGGNGGPGVASSITGTTKYYGGGGAGRGVVDGTGGIGGGGNAGQPGVPGTGGGGGGGTPATQVRNGLSIRNNPGTPGGAGGSGVVIVRYENDKQVCQGGDVTSYTADGLTYWVHTFTSSGVLLYKGIDPVLSGGVNAAPVIIPGAGSGGGGGSGSIISAANIEVIPGDRIEYIVGRGGAGVNPVLSTTNPAPSGKPGQSTSFYKGLVAAGGGLGGGGGGPNTGGVGAGNTPNPIITGVPLVPRTLSWAWSGHMNTYAVWDNYSDAANSWYTFRKFTPSVSDNYNFYLSCDNYGVIYLNGTAILGTTSFSSVSGTTVYIAKDTVNIFGLYAQNWGGPCGYALHVTNSAGQVVWDTRTYRAAESIESLPAAVSRKGGIGQNGTAGIGDGGHGGSNTFGVGGDPGLYNSTPVFGSIYTDAGSYLRNNSLINRNPGLTVSVGTDSFTFECWINPVSIAGIVGIYATNGGPGSTRKFVVHLNNGTPSVHINNENTVNIYVPAHASVGTNVWTHIAFVRNGTTCTWYVNGIESGVGSNSSDLTFTGQPTYIAYGGEPYFIPMTGYISNVRLVKTAVYTANFTPASDDLIAITGTALLLGGKSGFRDISPQGTFPFIPVGPRILPTESSPFPERPVSPTSGGRGRGPGTGGGGGASGTDGKFTPASGPGADGEVYIAWGPIIPRDPPPNLIAHFVIDIDDQRFYDRILPYCNPYVLQTSGFFTEKGRNYVLFNGTSGNYIGTPADPKYDLVRDANLSFTIEAWVILKGNGQYPFYGGEIINRDAEYEVAISQDDRVIVAIDWGVGTDVNLPGSGWIIPPAGKAVVPRNVPTHVAVVADQNTLYIYLNGKLEYTTPLNRVARRDGTPVWIGNRPGQSQGFNGGIADVRIWNVARTQAQIQANMQALVYNTPQGI